MTLFLGCAVIALATTATAAITAWLGIGPMETT